LSLWLTAVKSQEFAQVLYLTRKVGESIIINNTIELTVVEIKGRSVKIGFNFPAEATIMRKELHDRIMEQNIAAAQSGDDQGMDDLNFNIDLDKKPE
jgi:carbon storage regulator